MRFSLDFNDDMIFAVREQPALDGDWTARRGAVEPDGELVAVDAAWAAFAEDLIEALDAAARRG